MLVLSRKPTKAIIIGNDITVVVLSVKGQEVRLGIQAPKGIAVHCEEVAERIRREPSPPPEGS
jgi:carbon storage regulator